MEAKDGSFGFDFWVCAKQWRKGKMIESFGNVLRAWRHCEKPKALTQISYFCGNTLKTLFSEQTQSLILKN